MAGFHGGSRSLQDRFDTRALADRIDGLLVRDTISEGDRAFIEDRDMFFLARFAPTTSSRPKTQPRRIHSVSGPTLSPETEWIRRG